jgi:hypothetical protein
MLVKPALEPKVDVKVDVEVVEKVEVVAVAEGREAVVVVVGNLCFDCTPRVGCPIHCVGISE